MSRRRDDDEPALPAEIPPAANHVFPTARSYPDQHDVAEPLPYIGTLHHG